MMTLDALITGDIGLDLDSTSTPSLNSEAMMKDWITIGQLAKKTGLTARAIRFYESKGLLRSHSRGDNDYRFYSKSEVTQAERIKNFKDFGFTLGEIAELLAQDPTLTTENLQNSLKRKLKALKADHLQAAARIQRLEALIASLNTAHKLSEPQRRIIMEELVTQAKQKIKARGVAVSEEIEKQLRHEVQATQTEQFKKRMELLDIIKDLADEMKITLGPGRGNAATSLLLFAKGFNHNHSQKYDLLPELFINAMKPSVWIDVEYDIAQEFLSRLLKKTTLDELRESNIAIYQCPFLSILSQVEKKVGPIDFDAIADTDKRVLQPFWNDEAQYIFGFDVQEYSMMWTTSNVNEHKEQRELQKALLQKLKTYKVKDVDDILNLFTMDSPSPERMKMLEQYTEHESFVPEAKSLPKEVQKILKKTKGLLIYREDFIRILRLYLDWSVPECNRFSYKPEFTDNQEKIAEYKKQVPAEVQELLNRQMMSLYLKAHTVCMWWFIKRSALLNSLYPNEYRAALTEWRANHHAAWSDLGYISKDYRPLALYF